MNLERKERKTYGETVVAPEYIDEIHHHPYIPQSDAAMKSELSIVARRVALEEKRSARFLSLGMGPGRQEPLMAEIDGSQIVGLDNSPAFVEYAQKHRAKNNVEYVLSDFLDYTSEEKFDAIYMQGVWHHVPLEKRSSWVQKIQSMLSSDGILIIGDEFIPEYKSEEEREHRVGLFYLHIIGEALKIQNVGLARNECLNFLADTLHSEESRGYFDDELLAYIQEKALYVNKGLFSFSPHTRLTGGAAALFIIELINEVRARSKKIQTSGSGEWIDRGDYKVSPLVVQEELAKHFSLTNRRDSGPVDDIGGMSVLTFHLK